MFNGDYRCMNSRKTFSLKKILFFSFKMFGAICSQLQKKVEIIICVKSLIQLLTLSNEYNCFVSNSNCQNLTTKKFAHLSERAKMITEIKNLRPDRKLQRVSYKLTLLYLIISCKKTIVHFWSQKIATQKTFKNHQTFKTFVAK